MAVKGKNIKKKVKITETSPFQKNLERFVTDTEGIVKSTVAVAFLYHLYRAEDKKIVDFIKTKGKNVRKQGKGFAFGVPLEYTNEYGRLEREVSNTLSAYESLQKSLFVSTVTQFDVFFAALIKIVLELQPNIISPEKPILFQELKNFKKVEDVINVLISREVNAHTYESRKEQLKWMGDKTGIDFLGILNKEIPLFIELTERRNLFVHCGGVVDETYIFKCKDGGVKLPTELKKGIQLKAQKAYLEESAECLTKIAIKTTYLVWRKFVEKDIKESNSFFNNRLAVELIHQKKFALASDLFSFSLKYFKFNNTEDEFRRIFIINLALIKKLEGQKKEAIAILEQEDWSASHADFELAIAAIKDSYEECFDLMKQIGKGGKIVGERGYLNDPIFDSLRRQPKFKKVFKSIYKRDFSIEEEKA